MSDLDKVLESLNKAYKKPVISIAADISYPAVQRIPTGSMAIDIETGGGIPRGRVTMIVANESAGKTTLALKTVVEAQKMGLRVVLIDVEGTFDKAWAERLGVDTKKLIVAIPDVGEQACDILEAVIRSQDCGLVILDSIAAMMPRAELDQSMDSPSKSEDGEGEVNPERLGNKAQMLNRAMRRLTSAINEIDAMGERNKTAVILINQFREKVGGYGNPEVIPGGKGIKFTSSIILELRRGSDWIVEKRDGVETKIGQEIKFKTSKNKTYVPFRSGVTYLYFDGEQKGRISREKELFVYGRLLGLIKETGVGIFEIEGKKLKGENRTVDYLLTNPAYAEKLEKEIRAQYAKENDNNKKVEPKPEK